MTFSLQHRQLAGALEGAGVCPKAAAQIAGILCNSVQDLSHAGPITHDTTPPSMRRVTPDVRKHELPNFDFEEGEPDYRKPKIDPSESEPPVIPPPNVTVTSAPQQGGVFANIKGGNLSETNFAGDAVRVDVRSKVARKPAAGLPVAMIDQQTNRLVGKRLRANVTEGGERLQAEVRENNEDVSINLSFKNLKNYDVVTGVEYVPGVGLRITSEKLTAWSARESNVRWIYTEDAEVLTNIADDLRGFRAHAKRIPVFEKKSMRNEHLYFNTFRIGTCQGPWEVGTTAMVSQLWPEGGRDVEVINYTQDVPDDGETKYVLFVPRTEDKINSTEEDGPIDVRGEDEKPILKQYPPVVSYVAIEIQSASDNCTAFNYLLGKTVFDLPGYNQEVCQALTHDVGDDCLEWTGQVVDVVTNVVVSPSAITFMKTPVTILCKGEEYQGVTIPITECETAPPNPCDSPPCVWYWDSYQSAWTLTTPCENDCLCAPPDTPGTSEGQSATTECVAP